MGTREEALSQLKKISPEIYTEAMKELAYANNIELHEPEWPYYPYNDSRVIHDDPDYTVPGHPIRKLLKHGQCVMPILAKYIIYTEVSKKERSSDQIVDDLLNSIATVLHNVKDEDGKPMTSESKYYQPPNEGTIVYGKLCPCLKKVENAKTREDKIDAIEHVISAEHESGFVLEYGCPPNSTDDFDVMAYQRIVARETLDLLFGEGHKDLLNGLPDILLRLAGREA